jgi:predicted RNase H-like HicB family nuclease
MHYQVKISGKPHAGWQAWCPALPGCWVRGASRKEVRQKIQDAVEGYLASLEVALPRELEEKFRMDEQSVGA